MENLTPGEHRTLTLMAQFALTGLRRRVKIAMDIDSPADEKKKVQALYAKLISEAK